MATELCPSNDPSHIDGRINLKSRCSKTGKRIRVTDGCCNGCVPWRAPAKIQVKA